ncbi:hypothetical protein Tdes44962_MAKER03890 [Teratosphaeria destructans]|uniref:Uncharacterized protein n=1 Tax=Teratosphaeria destructans TaxID=418781 RepID=A0A9W7W0U4_9PEZI|nr:hypothetical protein Tdes44962_MAKER03890 [Teratosphaeria destructans]
MASHLDNPYASMAITLVCLAALAYWPRMVGVPQESGIQDAGHGHSLLEKSEGRTADRREDWLDVP